MITVKLVRTARDRREFLNFPLKLYKGCPYFVPPLYGDEKKIFSKNYVYNDTCEAEYFLAEKDGKTAGRISAIIQRAHNEKTGERRARFTRFDSVDDQDVASALFAAAEDWARERGIDTVCGPLGFSDLEREGLLIDGFDRLSTFEEQYNYSYYQKLIEGCGYEKEVDWVESMIYAPEDTGDIERSVEFLLKRYRLRIGEAKNTADFIKKYADGIFELLDRSYERIYGTVPFTEGMKKMMIDNFRIMIKTDYVGVVLDENDRIVCFAVCFPSIAGALAGTTGRLTPPTLMKLLRAVKRPDVLDFGLMGVDPDWETRGVSGIFIGAIAEMLKKVDHAETNLNLEDNYSIRNFWKHFGAVEHKRRRCFVKKI